MLHCQKCGKNIEIHHPRVEGIAIGGKISHITGVFCDKCRVHNDRHFGVN